MPRVCASYAEQRTRQTCEFLRLTLNHHWHRHERKNENREAHCGPHAAFVIKQRAAIEQRRMPKAKHQKNHGPSEPSPPKICERKQRDRDAESSPPMRFARKRVENVASIELAAGN